MMPHDPITCPDCDLAGLEAHMAMLLPLEQCAVDLESWLQQYGGQCRDREVQPLRQAFRLVCLGLQTMHDRPSQERRTLMPQSNEPTPDLHDEQQAQEAQHLGTRAAHLQWAKDRALAYCAKGDVQNAFASLASDLRSHPDLENHKAVELGVLLLIGGHLNTVAAMRRFIEGFN
jgi:hypothetical protein